MARPSKLTLKVQADVVAALQAGATHRMAADFAGIDVATMQRWLADPRPAFREFCDAVKGAEAKGDVASLAIIQQAARGGTWQAAAWLLERRHPAEYGRRQVVALARADAPDVAAMQAAAQRGIGTTDAAVLFQRQLAVLEAAYQAGEINATAYLAGMDRLTAQATRLAELALRDGSTSKGAPQVTLSLKLDSPGVDEPALLPDDVKRAARAAGGGDLIEVG